MAAMRKALELRSTFGLGLVDPLDVFAVAESLGLQVRFVAINSLEGIYLDTDPPIVLLSAERPPGRQAFTCAHEIGHHLFAHGARLDEVLVPGTKSGDKEHVANLFASFLLMPKAAVERGFSLRDWDYETGCPEQYVSVAQWLGVGYTTLITHMRASLNLLTDADALKLARIHPVDLRAHFGDHLRHGDLYRVDDFWTSRPIDLQVGDYVSLPPGTTVEGASLVSEYSAMLANLHRADRPGVVRVTGVNGSWANFARISKRRYQGLLRFRFLADTEFISRGGRNEP